jgi:LysM repeat protein
MRRGRHEFRLTVWTFVAPVALVIAVLVVINIAEEVLADRSAVEAKLAEPGQTAGRSATDAEGESGATTQAQGGRKTYRIKAGDTLSGIAAEFDTTQERLQELNPDLDPLSLRPGQRIRVG